MIPWDIVGYDGNVWKNFEDKSPKGYTFQESTIEFNLSFLPVKRDNYIIIQSCTMLESNWNQYWQVKVCLDSLSQLLRTSTG